MKTEPIIFPSHVIYLTEGGKEMEGKDGESWKNHSLPTDLSFTRLSSILGAPLNLILLPTGQQRPSAAGNKWCGRGGATTYSQQWNTRPGVMRRGERHAASISPSLVSFKVKFSSTKLHWKDGWLWLEKRGRKIKKKNLKSFSIFPMILCLAAGKLTGSWI